MRSSDHSGKVYTLKSRVLMMEPSVPQVGGLGVEDVPAEPKEKKPLWDNKKTARMWDADGREGRLDACVMNLLCKTD